MVVPFIALISPLSFPNNFINFLPSEIYVALLAILGVLFFFYNKTLKVNLYKGDGYLLFLLIIFLVSSLMSFEIDSLIKSVFNMIIILVIFCFTRSLLKNKDDLRLFFDSLIVTSLLCSLLVYSALLTGISLNSLLSLSTENVNYATDAIWWRATFFYTNAGYIFGISALIAFCKLLSTDNLRNRVIYFLSFVILTSTLVVMVEKTGLAALFISIFIIFFIFTLKKGTLFFLYVLFSFLLLLSPIIFFSLVISQDFDLFSRFQIAGFTERLCVFDSTTQVLLQNPSKLLFGFGPDASITLVNEYTSAAKTNCVGSQEGAIDGAYFTYLFDYGFFFVITFLMLMIGNFFRFSLLLFNSNERKDHDIYAIFISVIAYISLAALTDVIGLSKVAWIIFQIFSLFGIAINLSNSEKKLITKPELNK